MRTLPFILIALFNSIGTADPIAMDRFSVDLISWPGTTPQAGTDGALAVVLDIEDHWHLQAGEGTPEAKPDAIPTECRQLPLKLSNGYLHRDRDRDS